VPRRALERDHDLARNTCIETFANGTLGAIHMQVQRLQFIKYKLGQYIVASKPAFREKIREVLQLIKEKTQALGKLAEEKEAAGEVDKSRELLPSERDNICKNLAEVDIKPDFRGEVQGLCDSLDRFHKLVLAGKREDRAFHEMMGRLEVLRRRPGFFDSVAFNELEVVLADEWRWLAP